VVSEQVSVLAYTVTERGETGKCKAYAAPGSETGKSNDLCSSWGFPSKSQYDSRTQTEGLSPYWYSLSTTRHQADTTSTSTWKATDTTSMSTSNESVRVTSQILLVGVLVMSHNRYQLSHSLCMMGVYDKVKMTVPMIVRCKHSYRKKNITCSLVATW
jgi:hypothetical protein